MLKGLKNFIKERTTHKGKKRDPKEMRIITSIYVMLRNREVAYSEDVMKKVFTFRGIRSLTDAINSEYVYMMDKFGEVLATVVIDYNKDTVVCMEV